jgi:hypothetical protein
MTTDGQVVPDFDDEVVAASCVTRPEAQEGTPDD